MPKKEVYEIVGNFGNKNTKAVDGYLVVEGDLAFGISKTPAFPRDVWTITELSSGQRVNSLITLEEAKRYIADNIFDIRATVDKMPPEKKVYNAEALEVAFGKRKTTVKAKPEPAQTPVIPTTEPVTAKVDPAIPRINTINSQSSTQTTSKRAELLDRIASNLTVVADSLTAIIKALEASREETF